MQSRGKLEEKCFEQHDAVQKSRGDGEILLFSPPCSIYCIKKGFKPPYYP